MCTLLNVDLLEGQGPEKRDRVRRRLQLRDKARWLAKDVSYHCDERDSTYRAGQCHDNDEAVTEAQGRGGVR